jgi:polyribonucleotide nucleotidyltransferase
MFDIHVQELEWGGRTLRFETGRMARQADGAVLVSYGETTVLATVVADHAPKPGLDFFPLTVNYQEKTYAAGKIPGGFFKREGRPSEKETLVSRLIDRPIRPLFVPGFKCETQVIITVLSHDMENDPDMVAMVAASAALTLSGIPFRGPMGAGRVGLINGDFILNPTFAQVKESDLDLVVAGTADAVMMVESEAQELSEQMMLDAVMFGHRGYQPVIDAIIDLAEKAAKSPRDVPEADISAAHREGARDRRAGPARRLRDHPEGRSAAGASAKTRDQLFAELMPEGATDVPDPMQVKTAFKEVEKEIVRGNILETEKRIDGRDLSDRPPIVAEVGVLPRTHGSALFTRGETQALVVPTLGYRPGRADRRCARGRLTPALHAALQLPALLGGRGGPRRHAGRREIGHGKLAWRAIRPRAADQGEFPYTIRVVSEITESNGSSSMATVCGTSLALMDAGVPLPRPVAGIAMGLIKEGERFAVLSDILGDEDHLGDMDFKVAGTEVGCHLAADGHQDRRDHRGDHAHRPGPGPRRAASTSSARWPAHGRFRAPRLRRFRRGSPRSTSRPTRSAK